MLDLVEVLLFGYSWSVTDVV